MVTNGSEEMSSGTGWACQAMKHYEVSSYCTMPPNRDECHRYYRCNLGKVMKEPNETSIQDGWKCQARKNNCGGSNGSIPVYRSIDDVLNSAARGNLSFSNGLQIVGELLEVRYRKIQNLATSAVDDIKTSWISTVSLQAISYHCRAEGPRFHRAKVVNKLIGYYLISVAIYIIEISFWTNGKLFRLLGNLILEQTDNTRVLIALCIVAVFVFVVYLVGGEGTLSASSVCEN